MVFADDPTIDTLINGMEQVCAAIEAKKLCINAQTGTLLCQFVESVEFFVSQAVQAASGQLVGKRTQVLNLVDDMKHGIAELQALEGVIGRPLNAAQEELIANKLGQALKKVAKSVSCLTQLESEHERLKLSTLATALVKKAKELETAASTKDNVALVDAARQFSATVLQTIQELKNAKDTVIIDSPKLAAQYDAIWKDLRGGATTIIKNASVTQATGQFTTLHCDIVQLLEVLAPLMLVDTIDDGTLEPTSSVPTIPICKEQRTEAVLVTTKNLAEENAALKAQVAELQKEVVQLKDHIKVLQEASAQISHMLLL